MKEASVDGVQFEVTIWCASFGAAILGSAIAYRLLARHQGWRNFLPIILPGFAAGAWFLPIIIAIEHIGNLSNGTCQPVGAPGLGVYFGLGWVFSFAGVVVVVTRVVVSAAERS